MCGVDRSRSMRGGGVRLRLLSSAGLDGYHRRGVVVGRSLFADHQGVVKQLSEPVRRRSET